MKAIKYIPVLALFVATSCSTSMYVQSGGEFDDLYYRPSQRQVVSSAAVVSSNVGNRTLQSSEYYNNKYTADTLVSDEYYDALGYDEVYVDENGHTTYVNNNYYESASDNFSYANRITMFHGNYFYPYWRSSLYYSWNPYSYYYDPFYYDYYNPYYYPYSSYYGYYGYYNPYWYRYDYYYPYYYTYRPVNIYYVEDVQYGRRDRVSNLSVKSTAGTGAISSLRSSNLASSRTTSSIRTPLATARRTTAQLLQ